MSRRQRALIDQTKPIRKIELLKKNLFWTFTQYLTISLSVTDFAVIFHKLKSRPII